MDFLLVLTSNLWQHRHTMNETLLTQNDIAALSNEKLLAALKYRRNMVEYYAHADRNWSSETKDRETNGRNVCALWDEVVKRGLDKTKK